MSSRANPIFKLWRSTESIDLLSRTQGWFLVDFKPKTAQLKDSSVWQSSPFTDGRRPISFTYDNIIDTWTISATARNEDSLIELSQELERFGSDALNYWTTDWEPHPVYIEMRGPNETNSRYAIIHQIQVPEYANQFVQPFFGYGRPVIDKLMLSIEHGQWQNVAPGSSECVQVSSTFDWSFGGWAEISSDIDADILSLFKTDSGRLLAGTNYLGQIWYSDDDGATWALLAELGTDNTDKCVAFAQSFAGSKYLFTGIAGNSATNGLYLSTDDGSSWTRTSNSALQEDVLNLSVESAVYDRLVVSLYTGVFNQIYLLSGALTGSLVVETGSSLSGDVDSKALSYVPGIPYFVLSASEGLWSQYFYGGLTSVHVTTGKTPRCALGASSGRTFVGTDDGTLYKTDSSNLSSGSWSTLWSGAASEIQSLIEVNGVIYAGDDGKIWRSSDNGVTWSVETTFPSGVVNAIIETDSGVILAGDGSRLIRQSSSVTTGQEATCSNSLHVANKSQITNLTHIKIYDAGSTGYGDIFPMSSYPANLLPATPAAGDMIYFGIDTSLNDVDTGPFSSLIFDLAEPFVGWTSSAWEYWDGSAWSTLTVTDKTLSLLQTGVNSVVWVPPSNWATTTVDSTAGWWVRFRVISVAASPDSPSQQNRQIYTVINSYAEIASAQVGGDIPALGRIQIENVSDTGGPGGSAPTLYANRIIAGLRSYDRGSLFTAYLNASDEQNPVGVTVTAGTDTSFIDAVGAPSGRLAQWSPTGTGSWVSILTYSLATTIATHYYGTFRAFLRARQSGGTAGQMSLRLVFTAGSGGVTRTTDTLVFDNTNDFQILDFEQITLPLSSTLKQTELGDTLTIVVQGNTSSTTPDCNMYDLVLIPVDEWVGDFTDGQNTANSALKSGRVLDIDSITLPKRQLRNQVKTSNTDYMTSIWRQSANGPVVLRQNRQQRLWMLSMRTASSGSSDWRSEPDVVHRVQMWSVERYRWARGSR